MAIVVDGGDHRVEATDGLQLQARWVNERTIETLVKRDDQVVTTGTYELTPDGQSLVVGTPAKRPVFHRA